MNIELLRSYRAEPGSLQGRSVLITGAGQGLGRAIALECARLGAAVLLLGRTQTKLEQVYDEIVGMGAEDPALIPIDLATAGDAEFDQVAGAIGSQQGSLAGIVHCAADFTSPAPMDQMRLDASLRSLRIHLAAPLALTRACARLLRSAPDASVVFTGETHGLHASAFWGAFAAANSGLAHSTRMLALEWAHWPHLRVNMIVPGNIDSPQRRRTHPGELPSERKTLEWALPAYTYLLASVSRGVTGEIIEL